MVKSAPKRCDHCDKIHPIKHRCVEYLAAKVAKHLAVVFAAKERHRTYVAFVRKEVKKAIAAEERETELEAWKETLAAREEAYKLGPIAVRAMRNSFTEVLVAHLPSPQPEDKNLLSNFLALAEKVEGFNSLSWLKTADYMWHYNFGNATWVKDPTKSLLEQACKIALRFGITQECGTKAASLSPKFAALWHVIGGDLLPVHSVFSAATRAALPNYWWTAVLPEKPEEDQDHADFALASNTAANALAARIIARPPLRGKIATGVWAAPADAFSKAQNKVHMGLIGTGATAAEKRVLIANTTANSAVSVASVTDIAPKKGKVSYNRVPRLSAEDKADLLALHFEQ